LSLGDYYTKLETMDVAIPKVVWLDSKTNNIEETQNKIRFSEIDNNQFSEFLESDWGKSLLKGLLEV
jgi:hypothetical protein